MNRKKYSLVLLIMAAVLTTVPTAAQDNGKKVLNKEITLEKDFVPVETKATKKNVLPKVQKPAATTTRTDLSYSNWTDPVTVPTTIPTMMPYGYRTAHIFSDARGYMDVGGGTQGNFAASLGYRLLQNEKSQLKLWLQHNSSWVGKNSSKVVPDEVKRLKQQTNDNVLGVDFSSLVGPGTVSLGLTGHVDNFNYYGGWGEDWEKDKQTFHNIGLWAQWASDFHLLDRQLNYKARLDYSHAGYDKPINQLYKHGVSENWARLTLSGDYTLQSGSVAGLTIAGDYLNRWAGVRDDYAPELSDDLGMITLSPYYIFSNDIFRLQVGVNANISFSDGATLRFSPNVRLNMDVAGGVSLFANALGGKSLSRLEPQHHLNRYDDPLTLYSSVYTPLDVEGGFKFGPFTGFSATLSVGYDIVKGRPLVCYTGSLADQATYWGLATRYIVRDTYGWFFNAEVSYKYRDLAEATACLRYAPQDDELGGGDSKLSGYDTGYDRAATMAAFDVKVHPMRQLTLNAGVDYRGGRKMLAQPLADVFEFWKMDDVVDLHLGASYRFDKTLTVWAQAGNLLNRRYDVLTGMGAQRFNVMAGVGVTF